MSEDADTKAGGSGVAVCADPENIFRTLLDDKAFYEEQNRPVHMESLARLAATRILQIAATFGPIVKMYAAISLPARHVVRQNEGEKEKCYLSRNNVWEITQAFADVGFPITVVKSSFNAADIAIDQLFGERTIRSGKLISHIVVATGDGRDSFKELILGLLEKKKLVHVVCYERVPHIVKEQGLEYTCIAPDLIRGALLTQDTTEGPQKPKSRARQYKDAFLDLRKGRWEQTPYRERIYQAIKILRAKHTIRNLPEGTIAGYLQEGFVRLKENLEFEECLDILRAFTGTKALFDPKMVFSIKPGDEMFDIASHYGTHNK